MPDSDSTQSVAPIGRRFLWVDTSSGVNRLIIGLMILCAILFAIDFLYHRHTKVPIESIYGFYAIAGFVSFTVIVLGARLLRLIIRRDESYYGTQGVDSEEYPIEGTQRLHHEQSIPDSLATFKAELAGHSTDQAEDMRQSQSQSQPQSHSGVSMGDGS